jgi:hypothetical protein
MPSRPRTQVTGQVSWDTPCILYSSIIKKTSSSFSSLQVFAKQISSPTLRNCGKRTNKWKMPWAQVFGKQHQNIENLAFIKKHIHHSRTLQHWLIWIIHKARVQTMMLAEKSSILLKQPSYDSPRRLRRGIHMDLQRCASWRQTQRHGSIIQPWMPLSYPSKGKISTSYQV